MMSAMPSVQSSKFVTMIQAHETTAQTRNRYARTVNLQPPLRKLEPDGWRRKFRANSMLPTRRECQANASKGFYNRSIDTPTGKIAVIRNQDTFTLAPWKPALEPADRTDAYVWFRPREPNCRLPGRRYLPPAHCECGRGTR